MRIAVLVVSLAFIGGCQGGGGAKPPVPFEALESRPYASKDWTGSSFLLKQDLTINGQLVPKGTPIKALPKVRTGTDTGNLATVEWIIPPEFEDMRGRDRIVYGKRFGSTTWVRFDISGPKPVEEPTPYDQVIRIRYDISGLGGWNERDRWAGVETDAKRLTLFGADGKPAVVFDDVRVTHLDYAVKLLRRDGAMVVRHNASVCIYAADGTPLSPRIPFVATLPISRVTYQTMAPTTFEEAHGVQTAAGERYWLIQENGRILPKPDDLIGLQPLTAKYFHWTVWSGWLVWWKTPDGERCARVEITDATTNMKALLESRDRAHFVEWHTSWNDDAFSYEDIRRRPGQTQFEIARRLKPADRTFASVADATQWLEATRKTEAQERLAQMKAQQAAIQAYQARLREEAYRAEQARAAAEEKERERVYGAVRRDFDTAIQAGNQTASRQALLRLPQDPSRWTQYVATYGLDMGNYSSNAVSYARAAAGGTEATVLAAALKKSLPPPATYQPTYSKPQSDWDYFWNGPRGGSAPVSSGGGLNPNAAFDNMSQRMKETNQRNFDAWMRGAQNWGGPR